MIRALLAISILAIGTSRVAADWINLSGAETAPNIAEITVLDDRVTVALEVFVEDIAMVTDLLPDSWLRENTATLPPLSERMERFSKEKLQVIANGETNLTANLRVSEPRLRVDRAFPFAGMINPLTRRKTPEPPADKRVLYVELDYPFEGKPESLTFIPPQDDTGRSELLIGFIAYHRAVPVIDFRYLTGPVTLQLDWTDPWYSKFQNPNLNRHHRWPMMSFLYLEPREVRHEAVLRLWDLNEWIDLGITQDTPISKAKQDQIRKAANVFFSDANPVEIDGTPMKPTSVRSEFLELSLTGVQVIEDDRDLDPSTAVLGVILSYPVGNLPKQVSTKWELFNSRIDRVPSISIDPVGPFPSEVSSTEPVHTWTNHLLKYQEPQVDPVPVDHTRSLRIPVLTIICAILALVALGVALRQNANRRKVGLACAVILAITAVATSRYAFVTVPNPIAGPPATPEATTAVHAVLANANAAFQEIDKARRQEELDVFVANPGNSAVAAELERAINIKVTGGTTARVEALSDVKVSEILPLETGRGFSALAEWTAQARGQHWGHTHRRDIAYRARLDLSEDSGFWRLDGLTVLDMEIVR